MSGSAAGMQRWTHRFIVMSAAVFVVSCAVAGFFPEHELPSLLVVFGFLCPMIFGMGYLLLPAYVGRTFIDHRLPGIHFFLAVLGGGLIVGGTALDSGGPLVSTGAALWTLGVVVFVGGLLATVSPTILPDPRILFRFANRTQRSTRLATATIPLAIGYLVLGTIRLLEASGVTAPDTSSLSTTIHLYAAGFGALLIFSLSARLLVGFFRVSPPKPLLWVILITGSLGPAVLGLHLWIDPWFRAGAILESLAMGGYVILVGIVGYRTERRRVGYTGIALGAVAGGVAVALAALLAFGIPIVNGTVSVHRTVMLWGFFPLTIIGYALLFFPVTDGQFFVATPTVAHATVVALAVGLLVRIIGMLTASASLRVSGAVVSTSGALLYCYLVTRRFYA